MRPDIESVLVEAHEDGVIISLLLTEQCNFTCDHCFYACSPQSPNLFMSNDVLRKIRNQIDDLNALGIRPDINLIGGEPTINLKRFEWYLDWAVGAYQAEEIGTIEMTTNGWWLKELRWVRKFMEILGRTVPSSMYGLENGFTCRISNDVYHDEFHPRFLLNSDGGLRLGLIETLWESWNDGLYDEPVFYELVTWMCEECYEDHDEWVAECAECGGDDINPEYNDVSWYAPPMPDEDMPWLYIKGYTKGSGSIIPTSRFGTGQNDVGFRSPGSCASGILTYKPDGTLSDICCRGSNVPLGTVDDHPLLLLALAQHYIKEFKPNCYNCKYDATMWVKDELADSRKHYEKELELLLEREDLYEVTA